MSRNVQKFQIQLVDTTYSVKCKKCTVLIKPLDNPEHVALWPVGDTTGWRLHIDCYGDVLHGMVKFFEEFIVKSGKKRMVQ